jgi:hypothetical protein
LATIFPSTYLLGSEEVGAVEERLDKWYWLAKGDKGFKE